MPFDTAGEVRFIPDEVRLQPDRIRLDFQWKESEKPLFIKPNGFVTFPR